MYNQITLIGRVGGEPEEKTFQNGSKIVKFSLATDRSWKGQDDQWQKETTWHNIVCFGYLAKTAANVEKGKLVTVIGRLSIKNYVNQNGEKKMSIEVVAEKICGEFKHAEGKTKTKESIVAESKDAFDEEDNDDLPF